MHAKQDVTRQSILHSKAKIIAEILGMLAEGHRDSDWLLKEVKRHNIKMPSNSMNSFEILNCCSDDFITNLHRALKGEETSGFGGVEPLTKTYHWLFTDIVGGSNPATPTREQVRKITVLNELMARTEIFQKRDPRSTVILPVGDGVAIGFADSAEKPLLLAVELHKALYRYNQSKKDVDDIFIRIGIDMGPVYFVKDLNGKDNVWGPGIILTRRVMDLCGPMNIFASARIADDLRKLSPEYGKILHPIGNHSIKHGEELFIYNIYGNGFGNKAAPRKAKIATADLERDLRKHNNFSFNEIELKLDILDSKTWLTRHTLIWKVVNESKESMQQIFYSLDGDTSKEFGDLNVSIKDDHDNNLEILAVNVNRPQHKEFNVQFKKPLKPNQKKTIILQYDWEEPERSHFYNLASGCKRFHFNLTSDEQAEITPKVLKIDAETGSKIDAIPTPSITIENYRTIVDWSRNDLISDEAYQFIW